jgi:membrane protein implicated in regulation of membrane protease activity
MDQDLVKYFAILNPWHWWMLATLLVIGELLAPCGYYLALAIPAAIVGLVWQLWPEMTVAWQLGLFAVLSALTLGMAHWRRHRLIKMRSEHQKQDQ